MVMATGAASIAASLMGMRAVALALFAVNAVVFATLWSLTLIRVALFFPRIVADLKDHARGPGFFTVVAGTCVFGTQCLIVGGAPVLAKVLWGVGIGLWVVVMYSFFTAVTIRERKPTIESGINGAWLIAAVATQSVSVLGSLLAPTFGEHRHEVLFFALCLFLIGCMLYLAIITLIFYRLTFIRLTPQTMAPPYWINMGAVAITTLAGATLLLHADEWPFLQELQPFLRGWTLFFWVTATWWIPLLFILMVWRHAYMRYPLKYDPTYWGMAFPLAMYATGSFQLFTALRLPFMLIVPRSFLFVALTVWTGTFIGLLHSLFRAWTTGSRLPDVAKAPDAGPQFPA
ncbi:tellurite resistance/C4-dicarboxylate transporter family protein [Myxococcota bacterium]|nr:tellurite resistance/C4-dicarboxylate transporter family protein [Myxococcota bacterium]